MKPYQKPALAILGSAAVLIQGNKNSNPDANPLFPGPMPDCELDD